jgi:hypothetical protein
MAYQLDKDPYIDPETGVIKEFIWGKRFRNPESDRGRDNRCCYCDTERTSDTR